jgi:hypothetical protein
MKVEKLVIYYDEVQQTADKFVTEYNKNSVLPIFHQFMMKNG